MYSRNIPSSQDAFRYDAILKPMFDDGGIETLIQAWSGTHGAVVEGIDEAEQDARVSDEDYGIILWLTLQ